RGETEHGVSLADPAEPGAAAAAKAAEMQAAVNHLAPPEIDGGVRAGRGGEGEDEGEVGGRAPRWRGGGRCGKSGCAAWWRGVAVVSGGRQRSALGRTMVLPGCARTVPSTHHARGRWNRGMGSCSGWLVRTDARFGRTDGLRQHQRLPADYRDAVTTPAFDSD